jgi:HAE1 family hydrophobic/amphiphilic exporter-1
MLSFRFLKHRQKGHFAGESRLHRVYAWSEITFANIEQGYSNLLGWSLMHKKLVIAMTLILFLLSVLLTRLIGVEFMPSADEGEVRISLRMAVGTRLEIVDTATQAIESIILKQVPELSSVITTVGGSGGRGSGSSGSYTASFQLRLVPKAQRSRSSDEIANDLRQKLTGLPGVTIRVNPGQGLFVLRMGTTTANNVSVEIRGYDMDTANELAHHVERLILEVSGITDTQISRDVGDPEQVIRIDRQKAADLGLTVARIGNMLQTSIGGTLASNFRQGGNEYHILVRLSEQDRKDLANLLDLTIVNNQGQPVVLRNVVSSIPREGPVQIERKNQERIITVSANFTGRDMGSIISDIRQKLQSVPIPKDFTILFGGDYEEQQKAFKELLFSFFLAVFLVYLVMAGQFESFRHPFIILFSIPMALTGVTLTMILSNTIFSMQAFIGCILLAGIVVNNAILLVDYTNQLRSYHNMGMLEAIKTAGARRLRPILMTALTTCLGLVPLSLGLGEGGEAQAPMARVVIGGLMSATLITLVFIPVVYSIFERKSVSKEMETS